MPSSASSLRCLATKGLHPRDYSNLPHHLEHLKPLAILARDKVTDPGYLLGHFFKGKTIDVETAELIIEHFKSKNYSLVETPIRNHKDRIKQKVKHLWHHIRGICPLKTSPINGIMNGAARGNHIEVIKAACSSGTPLHASDLRLAIENRHISAFFELIKHIDDINALIDGTTPLHIAASTGQHWAVRILLNRGANVDTRNDSQNTALHCASKKGNADTIKELIAAGANVNATNIHALPPLHFAARAGKVDAIYALIDAGANVLLIDNVGHSALHFAVGGAKANVINALIDAGLNINLQNQLGHSALHLAAMRGNIKVIQALINSGINIHALDGINQNCLAYTFRSSTYLFLLWKGVRPKLIDVTRGIDSTVQQLIVKVLYSIPFTVSSIIKPPYYATKFCYKTLSKGLSWIAKKTSTKIGNYLFGSEPFNF